jgi:hypothetical protein
MSAIRSGPVGGLLLALLLGCGERSPLRGPLEPSLDETVIHTVFGSVLGQEGNICNSLPASSALAVRAFDPATAAFAGAIDLVCPDNVYAFGLETGTYFLRVELPADPTALGQLPWRTIGTDPVVVGEEDVTRDLTVAPGTPLGGHVTFEGSPVAGVGLSLRYADAPPFGAATGASGADGGWGEFFGRAPMLLQGGARLLAVLGCGDPFGQFFLGARVVAAPPAEPFLFPGERNAIDCGLATAPATRFSHTLTSLAVTPMPGDIGGLSDEQLGQFGAGWGVQLLGAGERPRHGSITFSQLFRGGLVVGVGPDAFLTGFNFGGYGDCGSACRDFGLDATLSASATRPSAKKTVTWRYSDAASPDAVGLGVVQRSYDGPRGSAYVVFQFTFTNTTGRRLTFYPGVLMDWDVGDADFDAFDDVAFTERDGRLMYMTDAPGGPGTYDGTLIFGAPVAGNAVLTVFGHTQAQLADFAAGAARIPSSEAPADHRYIHTVGPIGLAPHRRATIWVAVVGGRSASEFFANVDAATADVGRRRAQGSEPAEVEAVTERARPAGGASRAVSPQCKRGCRPG